MQKFGSFTDRTKNLNFNQGGKAVDAVEKSVRVMEDNGNFNAGTGSILNNNDEVECDAMIMDGFTMDLGSCKYIYSSYS